MSYLSDSNNSNIKNFGQKAERVERQRLRKTLGNYGLFISNSLIIERIEK